MASTQTMTSETPPTGHHHPPAHDSTSEATVSKPASVGDSSQLEAFPTSVGMVLDAQDVPGLPRLNYNPLHYKWKLFPVVFLLVAESGLIPIAFFYGLWYGTDLRHGILFAIITALFGLVTGIEFGFRSLKLILPPDTYRPIGGARWKCDFTHWNLSFAYTYMTAILIGASIPHEPLVRPLAMPVPLFLLQVGGMLIVTGVMNAMNRPTPFRMSSIPKGARTRPLVYTILEDIIGVDGSAGIEYRRSLMARYETSPRFRKMIAQQNWFWGIGGFLAGVAAMVGIWTLKREIAYGFGWGLPLVWCALWTTISIIWVRKSLRREKALWRADSVSSTSNANTLEMQQSMAAA